MAIAGAQPEADKEAPTRALNDDDLFARLQSLFDYRDGALYWRYDPAKPSNWNKRWPGTRAGNFDASSTYRKVGVYGRNYLEHRLIFAWHHGAIPDGAQIDHIDGGRVNNAIENLRLASAQTNRWNVKRNSANTSGYKGVSYIPRLKKFKASIAAGGIHHHLGCFLSAKTAHEAYIAAAKNLHGEFACAGRE